MAHLTVKDRIELFKHAVEKAVQNQSDLSHATAALSCYDKHKSALESWLPEGVVAACQNALVTNKDQSYVMNSMKVAAEYFGIRIKNIQ